MWSGLLEVTVNISALVLQRLLTSEYRLDDATEAKARVARYFDQPASERRLTDLAAEDPIYPLFLFDQLRQSFGPGFYPAVSQTYRVRRIRGESMPTADQDQRDLFAQIASQVADRDLGPFFTEWGVPLSASVLHSLTAYPPLAHPIWSAIDSRDARIERAVGYNLPVGVLAAAGTTLYLGERRGFSGQVSGVSTLDGSPGTVVARETRAPDVGVAGGRVLAILEASDATQEALWRAVPVTVVSAVEFVGIMDMRAGWVGVSRDGTRLVATSTGRAPHDHYFKGRPYYQITLQDASRRTLVSVTVNGDELHDKVVAALDGVTVGNGYRLRIAAAEPSRVRVYQDGQKVGALRYASQTVLIRGGRFVV